MRGVGVEAADFAGDRHGRGGERLGERDGAADRPAENDNGLRKRRHLTRARTRYERAPTDLGYKRRDGEHLLGRDGRAGDEHPDDEDGDEEEGGGDEVLDGGDDGFAVSRGDEVVFDVHELEGFGSRFFCLGNVCTIVRTGS